VRARHPRDRRQDPIPVVLAGGVHDDVAQRSGGGALEHVDRADDPAGVADRAGHATEHARAVVELHAYRQAVLGARCGAHFLAPSVAGGTASSQEIAAREAQTGALATRSAWPRRVGAVAVQTKQRAGGAAEAAPSERRLFLIDGPSLVYRAFFALPESIATSTGVPTNAIFGFASMLVKIVTDYGVCPTVVAWDAGTSGRNDIYPDYKAQRRSRPDLLKEQWPAMEPLVDAFGYTNVRIEGYEADDVIASLAERALRAEPQVPVMIVTGDRDVFQLIDGDGLVKVMATARGITETKIYDRQAVVDRYGIGPELIPDFYGLKGDTSDNIPGIPGIGDKTASELLQSFGTLEEVLANVDRVKGAKRKENLIEHAEDARVS